MFSLGFIRFKSWPKSRPPSTAWEYENIQVRRRCHCSGSRHVCEKLDLQHEVYRIRHCVFVLALHSYHFTGTIKVQAKKTGKIKELFIGLGSQTLPREYRPLWSFFVLAFRDDLVSICKELMPIHIPHRSLNSAFFNACCAWHNINPIERLNVIKLMEICKNSSCTLRTDTSNCWNCVLWCKI